MDSYCAWCGKSLEKNPLARHWKTWKKRLTDAGFVLLTGVLPETRETHGICLKCLKKHEPELYRQYIQPQVSTLWPYP